ncbi:MAG TPA: flagellar hook-basal body complex protein FliE [Bacillota bacterium]|nr:flagellar hook-basal body complex protein FliE [Bacillota bacterium]
MNRILHHVMPNDFSQPTNGQSTVSPAKAQDGFAKTLKAAIDKLNTAEKVSDRKTEAFANGQIDDLHDVMITAQKAKMTLETSVQIQQKVIDAYNEMMRMQL